MSPEPPRLPSRPSGLQRFLGSREVQLFRINNCPLHGTSCKAQPLIELASAHAHMRPDGGKIVKA